jgi:hypothetical protein
MGMLIAVAIVATKLHDGGDLMRSTLARIKTALVLIVLMAVSIVPIPVTSTLGLLIVIFRPNWFKRLVDAIYCDKQL